ncbi:MAG: hypothetical protein JJU00_08485 [Opitutales bacterium]|nr:hypothetical protein [Opitutales bacterium]
MILKEQLDKAVRTLVGRGHSPEEAEDIVMAIGDCIEESEDGKWIARDAAGVEFARVDPYL